MTTPAVATSATPTLDALAATRDRILALVTPIDEAAWHRPTLLPSWDVQDVVAHLGSLEAMLLGREEPAHRAAMTAHVRNDLGRLNENLVDRRRSWTPVQVLEEFRDATACRLEELRSLDERDLAREVPSPAGRTMPLRDFLGVRLWDFVTHELDLADALGKPLPVSTPEATRVLDEMLQLLPRALAKAGAPDGTAVRLEVRSPTPRVVVARMEGGRGVAVAHASTTAPAAADISATPAGLLLVGTGRRTPADAVSAAEVTVAGDAELAQHVLARLNVVP